MAEEGISEQEQTWLDDFLKYRAGELISGSPVAAKAADGLMRALGGAAPADNIEGWLTSVPEVVDKAALLAVGKATEPRQHADEITDEITDETYAELAAALATDLDRAVAAGEDEMLDFMLHHEDGLGAQIRRLVAEELKEFELAELDDDDRKQFVQEILSEALDQAFEGLNEGVIEAGGYEWLLAIEEA